MVLTAETVERITVYRHFNHSKEKGIFLDNVTLSKGFSSKRQQFVLPFRYCASASGHIAAMHACKRKRKSISKNVNSNRIMAINKFASMIYRSFLTCFMPIE